MLTSAAQRADTTAGALRPVFFSQMVEGADADAHRVFIPPASCVQYTNKSGESQTQSAGEAHKARRHQEEQEILSRQKASRRLAGIAAKEAGLPRAVIRRQQNAQKRNDPLCPFEDVGWLCLLRCLLPLLVTMPPSWITLPFVAQCLCGCMSEFYAASWAPMFSQRSSQRLLNRRTRNAVMRSIPFCESHR